MKKIITVLLIVSLLMMEGCIGMQDKYTSNDIKEYVVKYMEEKYNQKFEVLGMGKTIPMAASNAYAVTLNPVQDGYKPMIIVNWDYRGGQVEIDDNYQHYLYKDEINEVMDQQLSEVFNGIQYSTFSTIGGVEGRYEKEMISMTNMLNTGLMSIDTRVYLSKEMLSEDEKVKLSIYEIHQNLQKRYGEDVDISINISIYDDETFHKYEDISTEYKKTDVMYFGETQSYINSRPHTKILKTIYFTTYNGVGEVDIREY